MSTPQSCTSIFCSSPDNAIIGLTVSTTWQVLSQYYIKHLTDFGGYGFSWSQDTHLL